MTLSELQARQMEERRALIAAALRATDGNRSAAARVLGTKRTYLQRLIRDLDPPREPVSRGGYRPRTT